MNVDKEKLIVVVSGISGAGKSTLIYRFIMDNPDKVSLVVSHTTRSKREKESDGIDYFFIDKQCFVQKIQHEEFAEYVECYGNYYGTHKESIWQVLKTKDVCLLDLEWTGAYKILHRFDCHREKIRKIGILIVPPSLATQKERLQNRNSETPETMKIRIDNSFKYDRMAKYDFIIVNRDIEKAYSDFARIINDVR
jgi:guanylate kinase